MYIYIYIYIHISPLPPGRSNTIPKTENPFSKTDFYPIEIQAGFDIGCQEPSETMLRPVIFVWTDSNMGQHYTSPVLELCPDPPRTSTRTKTRINTRFKTRHKTCPKTDPQIADQKVY